MLRRGATYVMSAILPIRNVDRTSLPIAHIVLILKAELFLRTTTGREAALVDHDDRKHGSDTARVGKSCRVGPDKGRLIIAAERVSCLLHVPNRNDGPGVPLTRANCAGGIQELFLTRGAYRTITPQFC